MKGIIRWFVDNRVAANLLMWILVIGGLVSIPNILIEEFPTMDAGIVQIQVNYPGAAPEEVESGICKRIEEAVDSVDSIKRLDTRAYEGLCHVMAELEQGADESQAASDIETRVNAIKTLPSDAERPVVSRMTFTATVLNMALSGDIPIRTLKELGEEIRDDIAALPEVSKVELLFTEAYQVDIEISEHTLKQYGLTLEQVAQSIREHSNDIPGGSIKTDSGSVLLRTVGQAYWGQDFENIPVRTLSDGSVVRLIDIASINDRLDNTGLSFRVDQEPAVMIKVSRTGNGNLLRIARHVKEYIEVRQATLPQGVEFKIWKDESMDLVDRLRVLGRNALGGLILVLIVLALFLQPRVALWVALGLPIAMTGTLLLFPTLDVSISSISIMAFILVLGILVDDAIVVGERVHSYEAEGYSQRDAAIKGTQEVSTPVIFGVLTTMAAFMPLVLTQSGLSSFLQAIGVTTIVALVLSIIESQMILPAHLAHRRETNKADKPGRWATFQQKMEHSMLRFAKEQYEPVLQKALDWRYFTVSIAVAIVILVMVLFASGRAVFQFFPAIEADRLYASLQMPAGTPEHVMARETDKLYQSALALREQLDNEYPVEGQSNIRRVLRVIGGKVSPGSIDAPTFGDSSNYAEVILELLPWDKRGKILPSEIAIKWREITPPIVDAVAQSYTANFMTLGDAISVRLMGNDIDMLRMASAELKADIASFDGVFDLVDSFRAGKQEIQFELKPEALPLGISTSQIGSQVRAAFFGAEAQRVQRGREDLKIMVRYPEQERRSLDSLGNLRVRAQDGTEVALGDVAELTLGRGFSSIERIDGRRVLTVTSEVDRARVAPEQILESLQKTTFPRIEKSYPGVSVSLGGEAEESASSMQTLFQYAMLALLLIYALLAIPLQSYSQPIIIMSVIPFGAIGAVLGHLIMGMTPVFFSVLGIVALSGVVINSCLVLVDTINRTRSKGADTWDAVSASAVTRFRPIVLTSLTTFVGLVPLILDSNPTTAMLVPMAVSLSFGVIFATLITLFLVPCLYLIMAEASPSKPANTE